MSKREKRLKKGILSLKKQKELHKLKRKKAEELGQEELIRYYEKEIENISNRVEDRECKLNRKK